MTDRSITGKGWVLVCTFFNDNVYCGPNIFHCPALGLYTSTNLPNNPLKEGMLLCSPTRNECEWEVEFLEFQSCDLSELVENLEIMCNQILQTFNGLNKGPMDASQNLPSSLYFVLGKLGSENVSTPITQWKLYISYK